MRRSLRHSPLVLALGITVAACGGSPDVHELAESARSWSATADFTADRWTHGAISRQFAMDALERASTELQQLASSAQQVHDTSATMARDHAKLTAQLSTARRAVVALDSAAAQDDRARVATPRRQLGTASATLDSISDATEQP